MGLRPIQGDEKRIVSSHHFYGTTTLPFVIPSEAEGSAVPRTFPGNVFRQNAAQSTDLRLLLHKPEPARP
jgi:hypothetical protein